MKRCPSCNSIFQSQQLFCPQDGRELETGCILDNKYQLDELIGEGGMGQVYRATHIHIGTQFAVKVLKQDLVSDPSSVERFRREARAAAQIRHPNAVQVTDFGVDRESGMVYLVMELLDGISLRTRLSQKERLSPEEIMLILAQVCSALHVAHSKGIVHRDIKPDNIFLSHSDAAPFTVKVLDFGLAKLKKAIDETASSITQTGTLLGTPCYMSPEQCMAEPLDTRSDIYSLGVVIYQMFVGTVPFPGPGISKILMQHCQFPPPKPRRKVPDLPVVVETVILRALEKEPANRQQTMEELFFQLETAFAQTDYKIPVPAKITWRSASGEAPLAEISSDKFLNRKELESQETIESKGVAVETAEPGLSISLDQKSTIPPPSTPPHLPAIHKPKVNFSDTAAMAQPVSAPPPNPLLKSQSSLEIPPVVSTPELAPRRNLVLMIVVVLVVVVGGIGLVLSLNRTASPTGTPEKTTSGSEVPPGMALVTGGTMVMGNNASTDSAEKPEHEVQVGSFLIDTVEVTNEEFLKFIQATNQPAPPHWKNGTYPPGEGKYPVTNLQWTEAQAFARWAGKRLPTEAEWEFAAHGPNRQLYPWGNQFISANANTKESKKAVAMPVGSYPKGASFCSALDMVGNVAEWTATEYEPYPGSKAKPVAGQKVIRGGDFRSDRDTATTTARFLATPETRDLALGFRCAKDISN